MFGWLNIMHYQERRACPVVNFFGLEVNLEQEGYPETFCFNPNSLGSEQ